jgi:hypothetical protein
MEKRGGPDQVCYCWLVCPLFQMFLRLIVVFGAIVVAATATADLTNDNPAASLFARGVAGDQKAVIDCISTLEKVLASKPNNQLARVYLGSAYTLRSRDLGFGMAKLDALQKGIALMDDAAAAAPRNSMVQLIRAVTNEALPAILGRRSIARQQLEELVAQVEKDPEKLEPAEQQLLYLNAGEAAKRAGNPVRAGELWRRGAAINADPSLKHEIKAALRQL